MQDYDLLSLYVYDVQEKGFNRPILPQGWTERELGTDKGLWGQVLGL